jgi:hypothetical protein
MSTFDQNNIIHDNPSLSEEDVNLEKQDENLSRTLSRKSKISQSTLKGIFLITLGVCGNFVAETLGCKTQKLLSENMFAKQAVILLIIYFAIDFTSSDEPVHPFTNMKMSLFIWVFYLIFTKMSINFTLILFIVLAILYIISTFVSYYDSIENNDQYQPFIKAFDSNIQYALYGFCAFVLVGFGFYFNKQYSDHYKHWSTVTFMFGKPSCDSLK